MGALVRQLSNRRNPPDRGSHRPYGWPDAGAAWVNSLAAARSGCPYRQARRGSLIALDGERSPSARRLPCEARSDPRRTRRVSLTSRSRTRADATPPRSRHPRPGMERLMRLLILVPLLLMTGSAGDPSGGPASPGRAEESDAAVRLVCRERGVAEAPIMDIGIPGATRSPLVRAVDLAVGESQTGRAGRRQDGDGQAARRGRGPRPDPVGGPRGEGQGRGQRRGRSRCRRATTSCRSRRGGVQVDCPITGGYRSNSGEDLWGLVKDARIRLWPAGLALDRARRRSSIRPASAGSPRGPRWPTSRSTSTAARSPSVAEDLLSQRARHRRRRGAGRGRRGDRRRGRQSSGTARLPGHEDTPVRPRYDVVYLLDDRGWYYRYSHMQAIDPAITPGAVVRMGQKIGVLGKEGGSGGWSHLHFEITSRQPSGTLGDAGGLRLPLAGLPPRAEARASSPSPGPTASPGPARPVTLDGSKSWSRSGPVASFEWTFGDGTTATGPSVERTYDRPGSYSEILKVTDRAGPRRLRLRRRAGARPGEARAAPADDPRGLLPDDRGQARRPGHVQGADLPDDRRPRDLGLRRRHAARRRPLRRQRRAARQGRLRGHDPPLREAGPLPRPRRADRPPRRHGDRPAARGRRG